MRRLTLRRRIDARLSWYLTAEIDDDGLAELLELDVSEEVREVDGEFGFYYDREQCQVTVLAVGRETHLIKNGDAMRTMTPLGQR